MGHSSISFVALSAALGVLSIATAGCFSNDLCAYAKCSTTGGGGDQPTGSTTTTTGSTSSGTGGSGGTPAFDPCAPVNGQAVSGDCGIFVSASGAQSGATGEQTNPFPNVIAAAAYANSGSTVKAIYICGTDVFDGTVDLSPGISLYGGLSCDTWTYDEDETSRAHITGSGLGIVTNGKNGASARISSIRIEVSASPTTLSAIGILTSEALAISRVTVVTADALPGTDGDSQTGTGSTGVDGSPGIAACQEQTFEAGPLGGSLSCDDGQTYGGAGAAAKDETAMPGGDGFPTEAGGMGGKHFVAGDSCSSLSPNNVSPGKGTAGDTGPNGAAGGKGSLDANGFKPQSGAAGSAGKLGQGGGGSGSSAGTFAPNECPSGTSHLGATGAGGGSGGCGGMGADGGTGGGVSVGLAVLGGNAKVSADSSFTIGRGGKGGNGGAGQPGGSGGGGGNGGAGAGTIHATCNGAIGGKGGNGGGGGGGHGGSSVAVLLSGTGTVDFNATTVNLSALGPGAGGTSPGNSMPVNVGAPGSQCDIYDFDGDKCMGK